MNEEIATLRESRERLRTRAGKVKEYASDLKSALTASVERNTILQNQLEDFKAVRFMPRSIPNWLTEN